MHIRNDPSFFLTNRTGAPQDGANRYGACAIGAKPGTKSIRNSTCRVGGIPVSFKVSLSSALIATVSLLIIVIVFAVVVVGVIGVGICRSASIVPGQMANPFAIVAPRWARTFMMQDHLQSDAATCGDAPESLTLQLVPLMPYCKPQIWPRPHESGYSLARKQAVIILLSVSQNMVSIVSTKLQSTLRAIVGPGCLAAAAAELSPTSHPVLGAVHILENMVPAPATVEQPPRKDPQMEYSKIVPQSEQKY
nr:hypothetical protein [Tanacetum cinerariifolium]